MSIVLALRVDTGTRIRRGRAHFWSVIRDLTADDRDRRFDATDILRCSADVEISTIRRELRLLQAAGFLEAITTDRVEEWRVIKRPTTLPSLTADGRPAHSGQAAMWNAIRALGGFTHGEVAVAASTEELAVSPVAAKSYVLRLAKAGYLKCEAAGNWKRQARWRLRPSMNSGPLPPKILRAKLVWDPNFNEVIGDTEAEEVTP